MDNDNSPMGADPAPNKPTSAVSADGVNNAESVASDAAPAESQASEPATETQTPSPETIATEPQTSVPEAAPVATEVLAPETIPAAPAAPAAPVAGKKGSSVGIVIAIVAGVVVFGLAVSALLAFSPWKSLSKADNNGSGSSSVEKNVTKNAYDTKGKCKFYECLSNVNEESTPEEVEEAFGFAPETSSKDNFEYYTWTFDESHVIEMTISTLYNGKKYTLSIKLDKYPDEEIEQKGVTFDNVQEIKSNMNKGDGVSYDEFKNYMGGVDGVLTEIGSTKKYIWRSTDAKGYMSGSFDSDGKCTFMGGMTY